MSCQTALTPDLADADIRGDWDVRKAKITQSGDEYVSAAEQEIHIYDARDDLIVSVCCSHGPWITKLRKLKCFRVEELILNTGGRVLQAKGTLPKAALSLRGSARWK